LKSGKLICFGKFSGKPFTRQHSSGFALADSAASLLLGLTFILRSLSAMRVSAPLLAGRFSLPVLKGGNPICLADLAASLLLSLTFLLQTLSATNCPHCFSLVDFLFPVLGVNPISFGRFSGKPFTRTNINLTKPKRHEFVRTASHWKIFSSRVLKSGNPICFGRFSNKSFARLNTHLSKTKRHEFARTAIHWKISLPVMKGGNPICFRLFNSKPFTRPNSYEP
jgi:hypothetical protein